MVKNKNTSHVGVNLPFKLKISEKEKYAHDKQWFIDVAEQYLPFWNENIEGYDEMKKVYELMNNDLSSFKEEISAFCNPSKLEGLESEFIPYNKLPTKLNILKGDLKNRSINLQIILLSLKALKSKNKEFLALLKASVEEDVQLAIQAVEMQMKGKSEEEVQEIINQIRVTETPEDLNVKNFQSEAEIFYNKMIKFITLDQEVKRKRISSFDDLFKVARFFVKNGWKHGKPHIEVLNPLFVGFHKSPDEFYLSKADCYYTRQPRTLGSILDDYSNKLTDEEIDKIGMFSNNPNTMDKRDDAFGGNAEYKFDHINDHLIRDDSTNRKNRMFVGKHQGSGTTNNSYRNHIVWETYLEFKAYKEVMYFTYTDEYGEPITTLLDAGMDIPNEAEKVTYTNKFDVEVDKYIWSDETGATYEAERLWIPRRYEVTRLGSDVYIDMRECPRQPLNIERPFSTFELSCKGAIIDSSNADSISPIQRAIPTNWQYMFVKHLQNRELSKYEGFTENVDVDQIPTELGKDADGEYLFGNDPITAHSVLKRVTGKNYYSGSQSTLGNLPPSTRSPGGSAYVSGSIQEILNLQHLSQMLDVEMGMHMGISPQREASISANSNVRDNELAVQQSYNITEIYFYFLELIWKQVVNEQLKNHVRQLKDYFRNNPGVNEHYIQYALPDGNQELIKVLPDYLSHEDIGLHLSDSGQNKFYRESMLSMVHAIAQNAGEGAENISSIIKSISNGASPEEIHKMITVESEKQRNRQQQQQQMQQEHEQKMQAALEKAKVDEREFQVKFMLLEQGEIRETAIGKETVRAMSFNMEDKNNDGVPDVSAEARILLEEAKIKQKDAHKNMDNILNSRALDLKERDLQIKKEKNKD